MFAIFLTNFGFKICKKKERFRFNSLSSKISSGWIKIRISKININPLFDTIPSSLELSPFFRPRTRASIASQRIAIV